MTPGRRRALTLLLHVLLLTVPTRLRAGPLEARELLAEAARAGGRPWPERVALYRRALAASGARDRDHLRALDGLAATLERAGLVHGAAAFHARRTVLGARRDRARLAATLDLALLLRREGDLDGAAPLLDAVARLARTPDPRLADRACEARGLDAFERGADDVLDALARGAEAEHAAPSTRLRLWDLVGRRRLAAGDAAAARRALARAERAWRDAGEAGQAEASRTARLWLDLELRRLLAAAR